ncbi:MAG: sugar phosphate isomerase/epimerase [Acidobacteriia bacterium]|nr:sugar phosphate isomerase/epimerase [Terriglobia bacterium]
MHSQSIPRRTLLSLAATLPLAIAKDKHIPIGVELYSVRDELKQDLMATVRAVAKIGYECVEFFSPYFEWTPGYAKEVRKLLDDLGIKCLSTHNGAKSFLPEHLPHAIELNQILGSKFIIMASAGKVEGLDGWKAVAERLNVGAGKMKPAGIRAGFHNHQTEFTPIDGTRPIEILAKNTAKHVTLQLDVGTCIHAGSDPVKWIESNPGRITSLHLKDWAPGDANGYRVLFGESQTPWKKILQAAEKSGGVEFCLIEQEGSAYSPMETVARCLANYKKLRG